jgi:glucose-1-phosphate cytidylyltransferase
MKVVILAGGLRISLSEETSLKPSPMVEIRGKPIPWYIMNIRSSFGFIEFVICCGYIRYMINEYFANYFINQTNITIDLDKNIVEAQKSKAELWKIIMVNAGSNTMTGGRINIE